MIKNLQKGTSFLLENKTEDKKTKSTLLLLRDYKKTTGDIRYSYDIEHTQDVVYDLCKEMLSMEIQKKELSDFLHYITFK